MNPSATNTSPSPPPPLPPQSQQTENTNDTFIGISPDLEIKVESQDIGFEWNTDQEQNIKQWGELALSYQLMHNKTGQYYEKWYKRIGLPVVILTSIIATVEFSTASSSSCDNETWVPIFAGILAMLCAGLSACHNFLDLQKRYQQHYWVMSEYDALYMEIVEQLGYPRVRRANVHAFMRSLKKALKTLKRLAPDIPMHILNKYVGDIDKVVEIKPIKIAGDLLDNQTNSLLRKIEWNRNNDIPADLNRTLTNNEHLKDLQDEFAIEMQKRRELKRIKDN